MEIRKYQKELDEEKLMSLIKGEGREWSCYWADEFSAKYKAALNNSITYVAYEGHVLCGYSRSIDDCGFYIYVCDLLVKSGYRGKNIGRMLMECIYKGYPDRIVYVMSDVDNYYEKQGFSREGSIFEVIKSS
ncbi:MAG: GNAT family N-acetyltransferase [bacterium]|jgi:ribosomal protein S18 acetylase RimI-like enzyme